MNKNGQKRFVSIFIDKIEEIKKDKISLIEKLLNNIISNQDVPSSYSESLKAELQSYKDLSCLEKSIRGLSKIQKEDIIAKAKNNGAGCFFRLYYRGISNSSYSDVSAIYRNNSNSVKEFIIQNKVVAACPQNFTSDNIDNLIKLQHYGCPTQLLDVTENPLIALYFASKGNKRNNGIVNVYAISDRQLKFKNSSIIKDIAQLSSLGQKIEILRHNISSVSKDKVISMLNQAFGNSALTSSFNKDIFDSYFFVPQKNNARIIKQEGAFIINGLFSSECEAEESVKKFKIATIKIPSKQKKYILDELSNLGINEITLFPDLENVINEYKKELDVIIK